MSAAAAEATRRFHAFRTRRGGFRVSWSLVFVLTVFWIFVCSAFEQYLYFPVLPLAALLFHVVGRSQVSVELVIGADGLRYSSRFEKRFVKWSEVDAIEHGPDGVVLRLPHRRDVAFRVARGEISSVEEVSQQEAIVRALRVAFEAYEPRSAAAATATVMRGVRSNEEWLASLKPREGFRVATARTEDLWRIVEDHGAVATARAGAATMLMQTAKEAERARLRALAAVCAEPRLHRVLEQLARGQAAEAEMAALEDDPTSAAVRTA